MRTERIIHLLGGKWTQALKQFCGRRVSKCDHFVTCQEERELVLPGLHEGVGLSDMTVCIHPFRFGEEGVAQGRMQLKPQGCCHSSEKETHPEARKGCEGPVEISSRRCEVRRVGSLLKRGPGWSHLVPPMGVPIPRSVSRQGSRPFFLLGIWRTGRWGLLWGLDSWMDSGPESPPLCLYFCMVGSVGASVGKAV